MKVLSKYSRRVWATADMLLPNLEITSPKTFNATIFTLLYGLGLGLVFRVSVTVRVRVSVSARVRVIVSVMVRVRSHRPRHLTPQYSLCCMG